MPKNISLRKLVQKFNRLGFDGPYSGGRHLFMAKGELKVRIPNPHKGDISSISLQKFCAKRGFPLKNGKVFNMSKSVHMVDKSLLLIYHCFVIK